jgi:hypothetical protein
MDSIGFDSIELIDRSTAMAWAFFFIFLNRRGASR